MREWSFVNAHIVTVDTVVDGNLTIVE